MAQFASTCFPTYLFLLNFYKTIKNIDPDHISKENFNAPIIFDYVQVQKFFCSKTSLSLVQLYYLPTLLFFLFLFNRHYKSHKHQCKFVNMWLLSQFIEKVLITYLSLNQVSLATKEAKNNN